MANLGTMRSLALQLMTEHGLVAKGWSFEWDSSKRRAGVCHYSRKTIGLSRQITEVRGESETRLTILHEIAHARVGHGHGHDRVWQAMCLAIGGDGRRCYEDDSIGEALAPWVGTCKNGHKSFRHMRPVRVTGCGKCSRTFHPDCIPEWEFNGQPMPLRKMDPRYISHHQSIMLRFGRGPATPRAVEMPERVAAQAPAVRSTAVSMPFISVGDRVRLTRVQGHSRSEATVVKVGRTRYHVRLLGSSAVYTVRMEAVDKI